MRQNRKNKLSVFQLRSRQHGPGAQRTERWRREIEAYEEQASDPRRTDPNRPGYCEEGRIYPVRSE